MDSGKYGNYLLLVLTSLIIINFLIIFSSWKKYETKGLAISSLILFCVNSIIIYYVSKIKVTNKDSSQIFLGNTIVMAILLAFLTIIFLSISIIFGYIYFGKIGIIMPIISTVILYGSLFLVSKVIKV